MEDQLGKRRYPRLSLSCDVNYKLADANTPGVSRTRDISSGGICFITYKPFPPGTVLNFTLSLDHRQTISAQGRIMWTESFKIGDQSGWDNGIEFISISREDKERIKAYISGYQK